jgi:hypothetical protein
MQQEKKKKYEKPIITKIRLDAKCAVLGFCKTSGKIGPGQPAINACTPGATCDSIGS